jgi:hypothetical protein
LSQVAVAVDNMVLVAVVLVACWRLLHNQLRHLLKP